MDNNHSEQSYRILDKMKKCYAETDKYLHSTYSILYYLSRKRKVYFTL